MTAERLRFRTAAAETRATVARRRRERLPARLQCPMDDSTPDQLIVVFHDAGQGLLPLVEQALERENIDYQVRRTDTDVPVGFGHQPEFGGAEGESDVLVNAADADRAREILAPLMLASGEAVKTPAVAVSAP